MGKPCHLLGFCPWDEQVLEQVGGSVKHLLETFPLGWPRYFVYLFFPLPWSTLYVYRLIYTHASIFMHS